MILTVLLMRGNTHSTWNTFVKYKYIDIFSLLLPETCQAESVFKETIDSSENQLFIFVIIVAVIQNI